MSTWNASVYADSRWDRARRAALARDGYRCTRCSAVGGLSVHHVVPLVRGGPPFDLRNLRTLCAACHARVEAGARMFTRPAARRSAVPAPPLRFTPPINPRTTIDAKALIRSIWRAGR